MLGILSIVILYLFFCIRAGYILSIPGDLNGANKDKRPDSFDSYILVFVIYYQGSEYYVDTSIYVIYLRSIT